MIVVDASAVIELLRRGPAAERIAALLDDDVIAPELLIAETMRFFARKERDGADVEPARRAFTQMDVHYTPTWPHLERMWELRETVSAYDASYVVLAEAHECPLVTADARLGRAPGVRAAIAVV